MSVKRRFIFITKAATAKNQVVKKNIVNATIKELNAKRVANAKIAKMS